MSDMFEAAGTGSGGIKWADLNGSLLLIKPLAQPEKIQTSFGEKEATRANVTVLDGPHKGDEYPDTLVFPGKMQGQLRSAISTGRYVLGRLGQGVGKPGQQPPWQLSTDPTDQDKDVARAWINANAGPGF